jgi:galactose-1-phosphate uridylyltransferase
VAVFQNWLAPAGASFDHLHKQLVAIDELSEQTEREVALLEREPDLYERWGPRYAAEQGLVVARTPSAVAFVGVGHQYPSLEIHSLDPARCPWELSDEQLDDFADLLHACHAATGAEVPTNEEWHHRPPSLQLPMPLRAVLKWRVSTLAGFEGGTKIYVTTLDPWAMADRVASRLDELATVGMISPTVGFGRVTT